jgi:hypothetical protein
VGVRVGVQTDDGKLEESLYDSKPRRRLRPPLQEAEPSLADGTVPTTFEGIQPWPAQGAEI